MGCVRFELHDFLQNILCAFLIVFSIVLLIVCIIVTAHSLSAVVEQDKKDIAILRTLGMSPRMLWGVYLSLYGGVILM